MDYEDNVYIWSKNRGYVIEGEGQGSSWIIRRWYTYGLNTRGMFEMGRDRGPRWTAF